MALTTTPTTATWQHHQATIFSCHVCKEKSTLSKQQCQVWRTTLTATPTVSTWQHRVAATRWATKHPLSAVFHEKEHKQQCQLCHSPQPPPRPLGSTTKDPLSAVMSAKKRSHLVSSSVKLGAQHSPQPPPRPPGSTTKHPLSAVMSSKATHSDRYGLPATPLPVLVAYWES
jgi:hypothetical protein